ncbi:MAG: hypothetical protein ACKV2T_10935 [Kofleriaceae bacterium]
MKLVVDTPLLEGVTVLVTPLVERACHNLRHVVASDLPQDARIEEVARESWGYAAAGWEMTALVARVIGGDGTEIERRRIVVYQILWLVGTVMVSGSATALETHADDIEHMARSARPHLWSDRPSCVDECFRMEDA